MIPTTTKPARGALLALCALALSCGETPATDDDDAAPLPFVAECSAIEVAQTLCTTHPGNPGAYLRGQVALSDELLATLEDTTGDLQIILTHSNLGGAEAGGFLHTATSVSNVDLADGPVDFAFDMCAGGEMFSEENCAYNVIAILDQNGNNGPNDYVPDEGEPAFRLGEVWVSCETASPCLTLELDCTAGADCVAYEDPGNCACDGGCNSNIVTCGG